MRQCIQRNTKEKKDMKTTKCGSTPGSKKRKTIGLRETGDQASLASFLIVTRENIYREKKVRKWGNKEGNAAKKG